MSVHAVRLTSCGLWFILQWQDNSSSQCGGKWWMAVVAPTGPVGHSSSTTVNPRSRAPAAANRRTTERVCWPTPAWSVRTHSVSNSHSVPDGLGRKNCVWKPERSRGSRSQRDEWRIVMRGCRPMIDAALINVAAATPTSQRHYKERNYKYWPLFWEYYPWHDDEWGWEGVEAQGTAHCSADKKNWTKDVTTQQRLSTCDCAPEGGGITAIKK